MRPEALNSFAKFMRKTEPNRSHRANLAASRLALRPSTFLACVAVIAFLAGSHMHAASVFAAIPWHSDMSQAKVASGISHRPVLVVFTAKWSDASMNLEQTSLASDEAMALVTACFEPVRLDVDADPETAQKMGISHLPTACVIDTNDRVLAKFDCPDSSAGFVAAAGRAAQDAAANKMANTPATAIAASVATAAPHIRTQSDFIAAPVAPSAAPPAANEALLPLNPPLWPAEKPAAAGAVAIERALPTAQANPLTAEPVRASIEPAATPSTGDVSAWLNGGSPQAQLAAAVAAVPPATPEKTKPAPPATANPTAQATVSPPVKPSATETAKSFLTAMQKPFSLFSRSPTAAADASKKAVSASTQSPPAPFPSTAGRSAEASADPLQSMPVGLEGYCPVTLVDKGTWVEGRAQWGVRHRGRTYLFLGADQQKAFLADPDRYAPALSGDDPVAAFESGKSIAGQRRFGVTYQSRMYLFSSPESRSAFTANPQRFTSQVLLAEQPATAESLKR